MKDFFKFLTFKDVVFSIVPTVGTYLGYLKENPMFQNLWVSLAIGIGAMSLLLFIFSQENAKTYRRSLAEILAVGYFYNFTSRLGKILKSKAPIEFTFVDNTTLAFPIEKITVEIAIPKSYTSLVTYSNQVESITEIAYIREQSKTEPFWLRTQKTQNDLTVFEFPRTLFALPLYLEKDFKESDQSSQKIFQYFGEKLKTLKNTHLQEIDGSRIQFKEV